VTREGERTLCGQLNAVCGIGYAIWRETSSALRILFFIYTSASRLSIAAIVRRLPLLNTAVCGLQFGSGSVLRFPVGIPASASAPARVFSACRARHALNLPSTACLHETSVDGVGLSYCLRTG